MFPDDDADPDKAGPVPLTQQQIDMVNASHHENKIGNFSDMIPTCWQVFMNSSIDTVPFLVLSICCNINQTLCRNLERLRNQQMHTTTLDPVTSAEFSFE